MLLSSTPLLSTLRHTTTTTTTTTQRSLLTTAPWRHFHRGCTTHTNTPFDPKKKQQQQQEQTEDLSKANPDDFVRSRLVGRDSYNSNNGNKNNNTGTTQKISHKGDASDLPIFQFLKTFQTMRLRMVGGRIVLKTLPSLSEAEEGPYLLSTYKKAAITIKVGVALTYIFVATFLMILLMAWNLGPADMNDTVVMDEDALVPSTALLLFTSFALVTLVRMLSRRTIFRVDIEKTLTRDQLLLKEPLTFRFHFPTMNPLSIRPHQYLISQKDIVRANIMESSSKKHPQIGIAVRTGKPGFQRFWKRGPVYQILKHMWPIEQEFRRSFFISTSSPDEARELEKVLQPFSTTSQTQNTNASTAADNNMEKQE